jgi:hypothetical protein
VFRGEKVLRADKSIVFAGLSAFNAEKAVKESE